MVIVNSKNANTGTGEKGRQNCLKICSKLAHELRIPLESVFPSSTGVIGVQLPVDSILRQLKNLSEMLENPPDFKSFAKSIMTTDTFPKYVFSRAGNCRIAAVAKGSGMIEPDMATMLAYFFTDAGALIDRPEKNR